MASVLGKQICCLRRRYRCQHRYRPLSEKEARLLALLQDAGLPVLGTLNPFPGFRNLGNTCHANALLQCLFHCVCVRSQWSIRVGDRLGSGWWRRRLATRDALVALLLEYTSTRRNVILPHAFLAALQSEMARLGDLASTQQDVKEVLSFLLGAHTSGLTLSLPHSLCKDGVLLCDMGTEARSGVHDAPVDIIGLLKRALAGEQALAEAPPLVIVGLPNVYIEDGVEHWVDARATWSSDAVNLAPCTSIATGEDGAPMACPAAKYVIRGFMARDHKCGPPAIGGLGGHYVAFTLRDDNWFIADDAYVQRLEHPPDAFPYLVFLERRDVCPDQKPLRTRDVARPRWHGPDKKRRSVMKAATRKRLRG